MTEILFEAAEFSSETEAALDAAVRAALEYLDAEGDVALLVTNDEGIRAVNRDFRGIDRPTDVLSFPAREGGAPRRMEPSSATSPYPSSGRARRRRNTATRL